MNLSIKEITMAAFLSLKQFITLTACVIMIKASVDANQQRWLSVCELHNERPFPDQQRHAKC